MWKTIDFEPNYEVSVDGEVRNKITKKVKSLRNSRAGYLRVTLYPSGKTYNVHRLVAVVFLPRQEDLEVVNHINGVKTDNMLSNLEWCTHQHNINHAYSSGLNKYRDIKGEKNPSAKLTRKDVEDIRQLAKVGCSWNKIAEMYGVKYNCIKRIVLNISWK